MKSAVLQLAKWVSKKRKEEKNKDVRNRNETRKKVALTVSQRMLLTSAAKNLLQSRVQVEHELLELLFLRLSVVLGGQRERDCHLGWCWSGSCWRVVSLAVVGSKTYADPRIRLKFVRPLCQEFRSTFRDRTGLSCPWILFFQKRSNRPFSGLTIYTRRRRNRL